MLQPLRMRAVEAPATGCYPACYGGPCCFAPGNCANTDLWTTPRRQLEALLEVSKAIAQQRDLPALFHELSERLHWVVEFDFLTLVLHDPIRNVMRLHVWKRGCPPTKWRGKKCPLKGILPDGCGSRSSHS